MRKKIEVEQFESHCEVAFKDADGMTSVAKVYAHDDGLVEIWTPHGEIAVEMLFSKKPNVIFNRIKCSMEIDS